ncbi:MAG: DUF4912 domain-containing protein, partial [Cyanobacteria bacterium]|nr:DUF4912 domain-containing protein [Cyanobacteriota bacterium]
MTDSNIISRLASLSLRQLRDVARTLGISRYSAQDREGLAEAIGKSATERAAETIEAELPPASRPAAETRVVFLPRDPQWAYVFWDISDADRDQALAAGASQLCLRVADVTGLSGGSSHPHTLQEVVVDSHATEWYLPVPLSDRDYRVELGYRKGGVAAGGWISLAFSSVARVPALHPSEQILDQFVPFSLDTSASPTSTSATPDAPVDGILPEFNDTGLHERLYQSATAGWRRLGRGSEAFHEYDHEALSASSSSLSASGAG